MGQHVDHVFLWVVTAMMIGGCIGGDDDEPTSSTPDQTAFPAEDTATPELTPVPSPTPTDSSACQNPYLGPEVSVSEAGRFVYLEDFPSAYLEAVRTIRIYLPEAYDGEASPRYPVLYMHDGQNLFDASTSAYGQEWEVDETVDALVSAELIEPMIVVGIDNTADRMEEYTPTAYAPYGGGDGDLYAQFIMEELKPYVDGHFQTRCEPASTTVMGSSLGGLISCYIAWNWPDVFGGAGCMSSSFWWDDNSTLEMIQSGSEVLPDGRFWIDVGTGEGDDEDGNGLTYMVDDARAVRDALLDLGWIFETSLGYQEVEGAAHNESAWAARLANPLLFFYGYDGDPDLFALDLNPYGSSVALSGLSTLQIEVNAAYVNGLQLTVPNQLAGLESLSPEVIAVTAAGEVMGVAEGEGDLQATYDGQTDTATITVVSDLSAEVTLTFDVTVPAWTPSGDTVFIVGDAPQLGAWDPGAIPMALVSEGLWRIALAFERGTYFEYKFTRGSWSSVEKDGAGGEISNRGGSADADKVIEATVENWADVTGE